MCSILANKIFSLSLSLYSSTYMDNSQYLHHAHTALRSVRSLVRSLITIAVAVCMRPRYTSLITTTTIRLIMNRNDNVTLSSPVYLFLSVARAHNHWSPHYTHHKFSLHLCVCLLFSRYRTFLRYGFLFDLYIFNFSSSHFLRITFSVCRKNVRHICRVLLQMCDICTEYRDDVCANADVRE